MSQPRKQRQSLNPGSSAEIQAEICVRFTLVDGFFAFFNAPPNSFGWVGAGTLRFDGHGITVTALRRPFVGLHRSRRFISAFEIREVYREGPAVRVDLREAGVHRPFFWFWADDVAAAAAVVRHLAPKRSIEFDDGIPQRSSHSFGRLKRSRVPVLTVVLTLLVVATLTWFSRSKHEGQIPVSVTSPAGPATAIETRLQASQSDVAQARMELDRFDTETSALELEFSTSFDALQRGSLSQQDFANRLDGSLIPRWEAMQRELTSIPLPIGSAAANVREALTRSAVKWQWALRIYAAGLRVHDSNVVLIAFDHLRQAEDARRQAEERVRELEHKRRSATP